MSQYPEFMNNYNSIRKQKMTKQKKEHVNKKLTEKEPTILLNLILPVVRVLQMKNTRFHIHQIVNNSEV